MTQIDKLIKKNATLFFTVLFILLLVYPLPYSAQCAMCKAAAESDLENNPNSIARGLNKGIIFLMAIPYLILFAIFRKETIILVKSLFGKSKEPMNKNKMQWLTFGLTFVSVMIVLFIIFYNVMYP